MSTVVTRSTRQLEMWVDAWVDACNRPPLRGWLLLALAFLPVAALAAVHAWRYDFLCDDAFISFRYARNLLEGKGIVYNIGERVEGYTNFLWVMQTAALWKFLGIGPELGSRLMSAAETLGTYVLVVLMALQTPFHKERWFIAWWAVVALALNRTFAVWATSGLETRQFTLLIVLAFYLFQFRDTRPQWMFGAAMALAAAALTRPEGIQIWVVFFAGYVIDGVVRKKLRRDVLVYLCSFWIPVWLHLQFRHSYYGEWLPNTYFAKYVRPWPEAGFNFYTLAIVENGLYFWVPLALVGILARLKLAGDCGHALYLAMIACYSASIGRIGGDHFEYRLLDFYWPMLAVAAAEGACYLVRWGRVAFRARPEAFGLGSRAAVSILIMVPITYMGATQWAKYCGSYEVTSREETYGLKTFITVERFPAAFLLPFMPKIARVYNAATDYCITHGLAVSHEEHKSFWEYSAGRFQPYYAGLEAKKMPEEVVAARGSIGVYGYYLKDLTVVDLNGLTDAYTARLPVTRPNSDRYMAHDRGARGAEDSFLIEEYQRLRGVNVTIYAAAGGLLPALDFPLVGGRIFPRPEFAIRLAKDLWMPVDVRFPEQTRADMARLFPGWEIWTRRDPNDKTSPPMLLEQAMRESPEPQRPGTRVAAAHE